MTFIITVSAFYRGHLLRFKRSFSYFCRVFGSSENHKIFGLNQIFHSRKNFREDEFIFDLEDSLSEFHRI